MNYKILYSFIIVISILFIIAIATEIFLKDDLKPQSLFAYILLNTLISGLISSIILEKLNITIISNT